MPLAFPHKESALRMKSIRARSGMLGLTIAIVLGGVAMPGLAQDGGEGGREGGGASSSQLEIPSNVTLFGNADRTLYRPTAIVNGTVITQTDIEQRLALVVLANGGRISDEERNRLKLQVLRNLIDETLQIQEAAANDIKVAPAELDENFARIAANFKQTPKAFSDYLRAQGSSPASIKRQVEGELAWQRLLRRKVQPFVNVSQEEVRSIIDRMREAKGSEEYRIGEIYLSASPENTEQVVANARNIIGQIRQGGSFQAYARQYSEASTAAVGGDLGWVRPAQLPDALAEAAQSMQPGQLGGPIAVPGGFSILYVIDKRQVLMADPRDAMLSLKQISIAFPPGTSAARAKQLADSFGERTKTLQGCGAAAGLAKELGGDVVDNDGVKVRDLPPQLQQVLLGLQVGEATPPFGSVSEGVRVLVLCGRDDPADGAAPSFDQVMGQMEQERVNKRARIYLRDLRRDAVIEYN